MALWRKNRQFGRQLYSFLPLFYLCMAVGVVALVSRGGVYPSGSDTMYHVFRGDLVYKAVCGGDLWPGYTPLWYNGVEILRYWPPLPAYFMALCQAAAGGDPLNGYLVFVGAVCFLGALPWLWIGQRLERPFLGGFLGALWFFLPNNLLAIFQEGNLARALSMVFLPVFLYLVEEYLRTQNRRLFPGLAGSFLLMVLCHLGYAGMLALAVLLFLLLHRIFRGKKQGAGAVLFSMLFGFLMTSIWSLSALRGGISNVDSSESMAGFFQSLAITLNPLERLESGNGNFYFGLAAFLLAVFGILGGNREERPDFAAGILICLSTGSSVYYLFRSLPGGQYLWMLRFISIALCLILLGLLFWKTLRRSLVLLWCVLLVLDCVPSLSLLTGTQNGVRAADRLDSLQETTLIARAQEVTEQRMALMDESAMGSTGAFLVSDWGNSVPAVFGAGWEAASTSSNIVQLNKALSGGQFLYLFDRCLELGSDTVLVYESRLPKTSDAVENLDAAAKSVGYELLEKSGGYRLYHKETGCKSWGTKTRYSAIGIGSGAAAISLDFPAVEETDSWNLNEYSFEQLSQYETIYLAGFTYDDKEEAEALVTQLSEAGVHIVIAADGIPEDRKANNQSFLGITCNPVTFSNGYPELLTVDGTINADLFPTKYATWQTVFVNGLDECWGRLYDNGLELPFFGTVKNENIVVIGIGLTRFYGLTQDPSVGKLLSRAMTLSSSELPERTIVPLEIRQSAHEITVESPEDKVNTALAYHDSFLSEKELWEKNHLTYVNSGATVIRITSPYFWSGAAISAAGAVFLVLYLVFLSRCGRKGQKEKPEKEGTGLGRSE